MQPVNHAHVRTLRARVRTCVCARRLLQRNWRRRRGYGGTDESFDVVVSLPPTALVCNSICGELEKKVPPNDDDWARAYASQESIPSVANLALEVAIPVFCHESQQRSKLTLSESARDVVLTIIQWRTLSSFFQSCEPCACLLSDCVYLCGRVVNMQIVRTAGPSAYQVVSYSE